MTLREVGARAVTAVAGMAPVEAAGRRRWADRLRVIDYHKVTDPSAFEDQVRLIAERYHPVGEADVRRSLLHGEPLPPHATWVTFDDGSPTVIDAALPILARHGVPATFYVCPGLIVDQSPPWWEIVQAAELVGRGAEVRGRHLAGGALVHELKRCPDDQRRAVLEDLRADGLRALGPGAGAITQDQLERWVDAGNEVGNHTWDHPCLDRCSPDEQRDQIVRAHEWLVRWRPDHVPSFAYPNGDHTDLAEGVLADIGCELAVLADHRLVDPEASPLRISRVRLDASAGTSRARAVLSGIHSAGYDLALRARLTGPALVARQPHAR